MKNKCFKFSMGLAFFEDKEMKMLSNMAKRGWIFKSFSNLGYHFEKGEPQDLIYCCDWCHVKPSENEQYMNLFKDAGWNHVYSVANTMHFFCAKPETTPIYSDKSSLKEKYIKLKSASISGLKVFGITAALSAITLFLFAKSFIFIIALFILGFSVSAIVMELMLFAATSRTLKRIS